jgi:hypothetical protein
LTLPVALGINLIEHGSLSGYATSAFFLKRHQPVRHHPE